MNMKGDADDRDSASEISMDAVKSVMANTGYPAFNYDVFKYIRLNIVLRCLVSTAWTFATFLSYVSRLFEIAGRMLA